MESESAGTSALSNVVAIESAKFATGAALLTASLAAASPLSVPIAACAGVGYALAVAGDWLLTGKLRPLPICRNSIGDMLGLFGAIRGGELSQEGQAFVDGQDWLSTYNSRKGLEVLALPPYIPPALLAPSQDDPWATELRADRVVADCRESTEVVETPSIAPPSIPSSEVKSMERAYSQAQQLQAGREAARAKRSRSIDLIQDIATASGEESPKSLIFLGPSRSGKSWAMAAALAEAKKYWESQGKSVGVWWLSGKDSRSEDQYCMDRGYQVSQYQLDVIEQDDLDDVWEEWRGLLLDYARADRFDVRFFVFDEMNLAHRFIRSNRGRAFWETLIDQAVSASSNGRGQGKAMWLATQMGNIGSLGLNRGECGVFHDKVVFLNPTDSNGQFAAAALSNSFVSQPLDVTRITAGETGRYYHYQGRWAGLPKIDMPPAQTCTPRELVL